MKLTARCVTVVLFVCSVSFAGAMHGMAPSPIRITPSSLSAQPDYLTNNNKTLTAFFNLITWPNQASICKNPFSPPANVTALVSDQLRCRVDPVGNFTTQKECLEYFLCAFPRPDNNPAGGALGPIETVQFACSCQQVCLFNFRAPIIVYKTGDPKNGQQIGFFYFNGAFHFNPNGQIDKIDSLHPAYYESSNLLLLPTVNLTVLCAKTQQYCTGANAQYLTTIDCTALLATKTNGTFANAWSDTITCRILHVYLAQIDPATHCPNLGQSGGPKCVDYPFNDKYVNSDVRLFNSTLPFFCDPGSSDI